LKKSTGLGATLREHLVLLLFVAVYIAAFVTYGLVAGSRLTIAYGVIVATLGIVIAALHMRVRFSRNVLWAFAIWGVLHMAGGLIEFGRDDVLYNIDWGVPVVRYDRLVHAFGFGTASVACWQALRSRVGVVRANTAAAVLMWLAGMGVGALNEVVEFAMSQATDTNVGGFVNTGWDMIFNTLGTAIAAIWIKRGSSDG
jgi:hypothetical protein